MNTLQFARQLEYLLAAQTWPSGAEEKVLAEVHIVDVNIEQFLAALQLPAAFIGFGPAPHDTYDPGLVNQEATVTLITHVAGSFTRGRHIVGSKHRTGGVGSSLGRGLLEIEPYIHSAIKKLGGADGVRLISRGSSSAMLSSPDGKLWWGGRVYTYNAFLTVDKTFPPALYLESSQVSGSQAYLTWVASADRFDRIGQVLRRASGSTAPATSSEGTDVTVGADDETLTDNPGVGTWSYSLFTTYDDDQDNVADTDSTAVSTTITLS